MRRPQASSAARAPARRLANTSAAPTQSGRPASLPRAPRLTHPLRFGARLCAALLGGSLLCGALACDGQRFEGPPLATDLTPEQRALFLPAGEPIVASPAPPAIQGGTLLMLADGVTAMAADPDRDQLYIIDIAGRTLLHTIVLQSGDEPGRAVQDSAGIVHIALRRGGAIVSISPISGQILQRRPVCAAPSGIAYQSTNDQLHVACATGELISLSAAAGPPLRQLTIAPDLRDVLIAGDQLLVSRFRHAELLVIAPDGSVSRRVTPPAGSRGFQQFPMLPRVAWRMQLSPTGGVFMLHQRANDGPTGEESGAYVPSLGCDGIVQTVVSQLDPAGQSQPPAALPLAATVATDIAFSPDGNHFAIAASGNAYERAGMLPDVWVLPTDRALESIGCAPDAVPHYIEGEITAVAFDAQGQLLAQSREPAAIWFADGEQLSLSHESRRDTALALFHLDPGSGVACASCHPAGTEDGHLWRFVRSGARRTQSLAGTLADTAPYHWSGDIVDLPELFEEVFEGRMFAAPMTEPQRNVFAGWLANLPAPATNPAQDPAAAKRGQGLFNDPVVACASCHSGPRFTNNQSADVGSGGPFQVPSLIGIAQRAPYMHYGCAPTLADRFGPCGGYKHGQVQHLSQAELADLIAYLQTL